MVRPTSPASAGRWRWQPDLIAQMDADLSHDPAVLPRLVAAAGEADLVIGSRYVPGGGTVGWPLWRRLLSRLGGRYAQAVLGVPITDLTGGYKVWRRPTLAGIGLDKLRSDGYAFTIEATWRALRTAPVVIEVPIVFTRPRRRRLQALAPHRRRGGAAGLETAVGGAGGRKAPSRSVTASSMNGPRRPAS